MSLDNVLAVAAASDGDMRLVVFGIALSIPIVVWGSGLLATLMNRFIWIIWIGGGILGYVAGEMIMKDKGFGWIDHSSPVVQWLPMVPAAIIFVLGWWFDSQNGRKKVPGNA